MPYIPFDPDDDDMFVQAVGDPLRQAKEDGVHPSQRVVDWWSQHFEDVSILPLENLPPPKAPRLFGKIVNPL